MALRKPCTHGKVLCGMYRGTRRFAHKADNFLKHYGEDIGQFAQTVSPAVTAINPTAGLVTGAVGKGLQTYAQVRNEVGN